jgi:lysophospholipase L1-like esterase
MVQGRFQVLFLGDSVVWGQGLREEDKFSTAVIHWINEYHKELRAFKIVKAHSGAIIGTAGDAAPEGLEDWPAEVPSREPSIHCQMESFAAEHDPAEVDLVIIDGGINDVGIRTIFNPRTTTADLQSLIRYACGTSMTALLLAAATRFPNPKTKILVLGYYPILSEYSRVAGIAPMMTAFGVYTGGLPAGWNPWRTVVDHTLLWKSDSDELIQQSIATASAVHPGRFVWVEPGIQAANSAFAPRPWIYGVKLPNISPEDDVAETRKVQCLIQTDPDRRRFCIRASAGHPNRWGARAYFNAIYPVLQREYGL